MQNILKKIIPAAILFFLIWTIITQWPQVKDKITAANPYLLMISFILLLITYVGGAYFWYKILQVINFKTSFKQAFRVFIISNYGRFIPGVVLHYVARVYLSRDLGLGVKEGMSAVFLEAYYTLGGALIVSLLALPWALKFVNPFWLLPLIAILCAVIFIIPVHIFLLLAKVPYLGKYLPTVMFKSNLKEHLNLLSLSVALFLLYGVAFFLLCSAFVYNPPSRIFDISGLLSASWVIGFITPVAPGGLGVADLSFAYLLQFFYSFSLASFLVVAFRFSLFAAEGLMFLIVLKFFGLNIVSTSESN